eukprot:403339408
MRESTLIFHQLLLQNTQMDQQKVIENKNLKIFLTHGGQNSVIESLKAQTPMIILPLGYLDQNMYCLYLQQQNLGRCIGVNFEAEDILQAQTQIENDLRIQKNLHKVSQVIQFYQQDHDNQQDLIYWIDYLIDIDMDKEESNREKIPKTQKLDIDVKLLFLLLIAILTFICLNVFLKVFSTLIKECV